MQVQRTAPKNRGISLTWISRDYTKLSQEAEFPSMQKAFKKELTIEGIYL
jgi:hypothetical protein|tara:strand:+ start:4157 stop:4306 length:150 start_codon:yes stop_codon:yes gene_type:complete